MDPITIALGLAQFVPTLMGWLGAGEKSVSVANKAIDIAKQVTGTESGDSALSALRTSPDLVFKYREAMMNQELEFQRLAIQNASDINKTMIAETQAEHWPSYSWRPAIGFSFAAYMTAQWLLPLFHIAPPQVDPTLMTSVGAILGVASWFRGKMQADPSIPTSNKG